MYELCILFAYHKCDAITWRHFNLLKKLNPKACLIPLTDDVSEYLPNSIDVKSFPSHWPAAESKWAACDLMLYKWFLNRTISARRYIWMEYDCLCTMPLQEAYQSVWNCEVAASNWFLPTTHPKWNWFKPEHINKLSKADLPYAAGIMPLAGSLYSHNSLVKIIDNLTDRDVFCELRVGTAINKAGIHVTEFSSYLKRTVCWDPFLGRCSRPGVYHSIKSDEGMARLRRENPFWETKQNVKRALKKVLSSLNLTETYYRVRNSQFLGLK